ncbi:VOC family protein [Methylobacterium sp. ID0610]|uniref:VOC family protein n=1 Tax=Methylobacterium carpenticola TaxID=3344827 RepID=UPI00368FCE0D
MLSHVHIGIHDFDRAFAFYAAVLPELGWRLKFVERARPWAGWQPGAADRPLLLVGTPYDRAPASAGNGQMVALLAPSRAAVDAFYDLALAHGATGDGEPGLRTEYHPHYYGAYLRDPDGNKLGVCCHHPG